MLDTSVAQEVLQICVCVRQTRHLLHSNLLLGLVLVLETVGKHALDFEAEGGRRLTAHVVRIYRHAGSLTVGICYVDEVLAVVHAFRGLQSLDVDIWVFVALAAVSVDIRLVRAAPPAFHFPKRLSRLTCLEVICKLRPPMFT